MRKLPAIQEYEQVRAGIVEKNQNFLGVILREDEKKLDIKLKKLVEEAKKICGGEIPCDRPVIANPAIWRSGLYSFCKALPKGADLHVHGTSQLPVWKLIRFLSGRKDILIDPETLILHLPSEHIPGCLTLEKALEDGIIDRVALERKWTVLGVEKGQDIWHYFENLFSYQEAIDSNKEILHDYYLYAFEDSIKNGIFHLELHVLFSSDRKETLSIVQCIRDAYYKVKKNYPAFSVRLIGAGMKMFDYSVEENTSVFYNTLLAQESMKDESEEKETDDFVVGFDLINEEDTSRSLREYAPMLLQIKKEHPDFRYFLHCGESLNSFNDNLIDAYLLGATRVGHGMNLYRYPDLLKEYVNEEICLEVCPISNQTLRYTHDLRLHPGAEYLKRGVTMALCSDDAVYQEHEQLTDDFFMAIAAWGLGVAEIKQLCINSILYAALNEKNRRRLIRLWYESWNDFVRDCLNRKF